MKHFILRTILFILRKLNYKGYFRIQSNWLKGKYWNTQTSGSTDYILGIYEISIVSKWIKHLTEDMTFYDLGANCGYITMLGANICKCSHAFEPHPTNFKFLKDHIKKNEFNSTTTLVRKAVSDSTGIIEFSNSENLAGNSYINSSVQFNKTPNRIQIETITIDDYIINNDPPDFIKIDVEGAEYDVLLGAKKTIKQYKPIIYLSTHEQHKLGVKSSCLDYLKRMNYSIEQIGFDHNTLDGIEDWICLPI